MNFIGLFSSFIKNNSDLDCCINPRCVKSEIEVIGDSIILDLNVIYKVTH